jgi:hypothetical protein
LTIAGLDESPRSDVNPDPSDVLVADLDLSRVYCRPDTESQIRERLIELKRTPKRPSGRIEGRQDPVAGGLHEVAAEPVDRRSRDRVVTIQNLTPTSVAESSGPSGGTHDVGEKDRGQRS